MQTTVSPAPTVLQDNTSLNRTMQVVIALPVDRGKFLMQVLPLVPHVKLEKLLTQPKLTVMSALLVSLPRTGPSVRVVKSAKFPQPRDLDPAIGAARARKPTWATQRAVRSARIAIQVHS